MYRILLSHVHTFSMWRGLFVYFFIRSLPCGPVCVCVRVTFVTCLSVCGFLFLQVKCLREVIVHTRVCFIFACILYTLYDICVFDVFVHFCVYVSFAH